MRSMPWGYCTGRGCSGRRRGISQMMWVVRYRREFADSGSRDVMLTKGFVDVVWQRCPTLPMRSAAQGLAEGARIVLAYRYAGHVVGLVFRGLRLVRDAALWRRRRLRVGHVSVLPPPGKRLLTAVALAGRSAAR
jgi:hypothetical protein